MRMIEDTETHKTRLQLVTNSVKYHLKCTVDSNPDLETTVVGTLFLQCFKHLYKKNWRLAVRYVEKIMRNGIELMESD
jgi:hypothetical protein